MAKSSQKTEEQGLPALTALELHRIARPREAEQLTGLHWDTIKRNYPEYVVKMAKRAEGMRVGHALALGKART
jgi:hypothetical protein